MGGRGYLISVNQHPFLEEIGQPQSPLFMVRKTAGILPGHVLSVCDSTSLSTWCVQSSMCQCDDMDFKGSGKGCTSPYFSTHPG